MSEQPIPHNSVHKDMDPHFFADYALFSGAFRHYIAKSIEEAYQRDTNNIHKRLFTVGLYREEYSAYEDLGAITAAFIRFRSGELAHPVEGVLRYKDDKVVFETLFRQRNIESADDLFNALGMLEDMGSSWRAVYPQIDCERVLRRMCRFVFHDCRRNQSLYCQPASKIDQGSASNNDQGMLESLWI